MKLGKKLSSIRDVAKAAGVSPMTVSRVLNSPELVAEPTSERVQAVIRNLDYMVNELARPLGKSRRPVISISPGDALSSRKRASAAPKGGVFFAA